MDYPIFKIENKDFLKRMKDLYYEQVQLNNIDLNIAKQHKQYVIGGPYSEFYTKNPDILEFINTQIYPYDGKFVTSWFKFYEEGEFASLHQDDRNRPVNRNVQIGSYPTEEGRVAYTNSILLDQSPDMKGGTIVICGDGWDYKYEDLEKPTSLRSRLITRRFEEVGDAIYWDDQLVHGVSEIETGHRLVVLICKVK